MHPDAFTQLRPFAFHLTARVNLPAIERTRRLDPASTIFTQAARPDLLRTRRRGMTTIGRSALRADSPGSEDTDKVIIRDQDPLHPGNCALTRGFSFEDLVELLNSFVKKARSEPRTNLDGISEFCLLPHHSLIDHVRVVTRVTTRVARDPRWSGRGPSPLLTRPAG